MMLRRWNADTYDQTKDQIRPTASDEEKEGSGAMKKNEKNENFMNCFLLPFLFAYKIQNKNAQMTATSSK